VIHISLRSTESEPLELEPLPPAQAARVKPKHAKRSRWSGVRRGAEVAVELALWVFGLFGLFAFLWICGAVLRLGAL
jgi:hypothetical protein